MVIRDERIAEHVDHELEEGLLWPDPIVQLNPAFEPGGTVDGLVSAGLLYERCGQIFRQGKSAADPDGEPCTAISAKRSRLLAPAGTTC